MKFGNAAWGFRETILEKQLEITNKMGLSILELGIANAPVDLPLDASDLDIEHTKALFKKYNVSLSCAATGNDFTNGSAEDLEKIKQAIDLCQKLGVTYLRIFAGFSPIKEVTGERWDVMIDCLFQTVEYAKTKGVIPVVETHGGVNAYEDGVEHFHSTTTQEGALLALLEAVPDLKINFDPANLYAVGIDRPDFLYEKIKDRVCYAHFKDFVKLPSGKLKPASCGESDMNWKAVLQAMSGFDGPALFEYENTEDVAEGCQRCYDFIKKEIEK